MEKYPICLLVNVYRQREVEQAYFDQYGISSSDVLWIKPHAAAGKKKTPMAEMRLFITEELVPKWRDHEIQYVLCADADYFKALTKVAKVDANLGYVLDTEYGVKAIYLPNYRTIFYDPVKVREKIHLGMSALVDHVQGNYTPPGTSIIEYAAYPRSYEDIKAWLEELLSWDVPLTIDIEAFSLKHPTAGIGTITFCWNKTNGVAFPVDYEEIVGATKAPFGKNVVNEPVRALLKDFFIRYLNKAIYHNISYDVYNLIYQLFMKDVLDTEGLLTGLDIMLRNWDDTKLITYLATNSCAGNKLGLKDQAQEYAGNYAQDEIKDITRIPIDDLLKYNLIDGLSTWYVHEKHYQKMVDDEQEDLYQGLFKGAIKDIIQMQLTGMPIDMQQVKRVKKKMKKESERAINIMLRNPLAVEYQYNLDEQWVIKKNESYKVKRVTLADATEKFNPNSDVQLRGFLYDKLGLPVINLTDTKMPSCDADSITALLNHTKDPVILEFLKALQDFKAVDIILTTFISAMEKATLAPDGWYYLYGNFNLGGTVSGRLSSSKPNLQNIPATGSKYAKDIKSCFVAPEGWLFVGLDFASLEDRISAVTTKDTNKLKVYTDGYDGHCLRAYAYFGDQMPGIQDTVISINSIKKLFEELRNKSKAPTFLLTYGGTYIGLMNNCGFPKELALEIERRYHELYVESDQWVDAKLEEASKVGYVTAAFGLRVRTPLLHQVIRKTSRTPFAAEAEGRTAGNALGQSWCLLNNRAGVEFMNKVRTSEERLNIRPCAQIHDAQYFLIKEDLGTIMYTNEHLVKAVEWQEHPDIAHDEVKLGGELSIFHPDWAHEIGIPNGATEEQIIEILEAA